VYVIRHCYKKANIFKCWKIPEAIANDFNFIDVLSKAMESMNLEPISEAEIEHFVHIDDEASEEFNSAVLQDIEQQVMTLYNVAELLQRSMMKLITKKTAKTTTKLKTSL
jgi:TFIIF-interacting CTD phosphatase-like protein